jgi:hypothetical protein
MRFEQGVRKTGRKSRNQWRQSRQKKTEGNLDESNSGDRPTWHFGHQEVPLLADPEECFKTMLFMGTHWLAQGRSRDEETRIGKS